MKSFFAALGLILALASSIASAHGSNEAKPNEGKSVSGSRPESVRLAEELSVELVQARAAHARADRSDRAARLATLEAIARERHDLLALLMESDPREVIRLAMPNNMQVAFPASARRYFETEVTEEGVLTVLHVDMEGEAYGGDRYEYLLATKSGERRLHFAKMRPAC